MRSLYRLNGLWNVDTGPEEAKMFHDTFGMIFGKGIGECSEEAHVRLSVLVT